ncbi:MAG: histidinol dehydrogenase [Bacteroidales bacterium]|nr:histidinol dehydrogenase [Bacteroidales bacterium]
MNIIKYPERKTWSKVLTRPETNNTKLLATVKEVMTAVRQKGDEAVHAYGEKFDNVKVMHLKVASVEMQENTSILPKDLKNAIISAQKNIEYFHRTQVTRPQKVETIPGVVCWQKPVPIEKVGLYIPGGTAPLFSTVLMLAIPAKIAGCNEIILCTPPNKEGDIHPAILFAAKIAGVSKVFKIGGIQAIAAMTYGTKSVPKVYKIFGPGNQYVTAAKQWAAMNGKVAIDMPAGPSEVAIIADESANPAFVAADMLSQAEHGADSQAILLTSSEKLVAKVRNELEKQLPALPRRDIAAKAMANSRIVVLKNDDEIVELSNLYAPEHLIIETKNYQELSERVINAGSVFLGHYTPESAGDYASGTNHTLPTNGYAKMYSGVNLDSFLKKITFQEITRRGIANLAPTIDVLAQAELLDAHRNAVNLRINSSSKQEKF